MSKKKLLIIGGGNMGYAIACGITSKNTYKKDNIFFLETNAKRINFLRKDNYKIFKTISSMPKCSFEAIILATKPNDIKTAAIEIKNQMSKNTLIISIAAGIKLKTLSSIFPQSQPIARVMPNTPCQIGKGISAITFNKLVSKDEKIIVKKIFSSIGKIIELKEEKFDLVTAISGSGPAYFCYFIECLSKAATKEGINESLAQKMALETGIGTMLLLSKSGLHPKSLREKVTSKKGTTEAAIKTFEKLSLNKIVHNAVIAAKKRANELSKICILVFLLLTAYGLRLTASHAQEPLQISTETEDIALTDDLNVAKKQVEKYPNNFEAHFNLAIALSHTSLVEEAIKELRKTKKLIRKNGGIESIDKKINEYKEIVKNSPDSLAVNNIRYRLAFSYYLKAYLINKDLENKKDKKSSKINLFSPHSLTLKDKNPEIKESLDLSLSSFKELLSINPNDNWAKIYYGFILAEQMGEVNKARGLWNEVMKQDPNNPAPHFFIGELLVKEGKLKEGLIEISQAVLLRSLGY